MASRMADATGTAAAPRALGPYSLARRAGGLVWVAGQLGIDPATGQLVDGGTAAQARQALRNVEAILLAAGSDLGRLVHVTVYLADIAEWDEVNRVYGEFVRPPYPTRVTVGVAALPKGARIEIAAVAEQ